jgi:hypothetical protein
VADTTTVIDIDQHAVVATAATDLGGLAVVHNHCSRYYVVDLSEDGFRDGAVQPGALGRVRWTERYDNVLRPLRVYRDALQFMADRAVEWSQSINEAGRDA